jgi:hypothetical protein
MSLRMKMLNKLIAFSTSSIKAEPVQTTLQIVDKKAINHDCYIYKLKFTDARFDLSIGQHFRIVETIKTFETPEGEEVTRKYTPISPCSQKVTNK